MSDPSFLSRAGPSGPYELAYRHREGTRPGVTWLGGFMSDMDGTKATALWDWAGETGRAATLFDYMGHGRSGGTFTDGTISLWLEDALAVLAEVVRGETVLVGSSMGGWIALLLARRLCAEDPERARLVKGMVLIAPAVDFTERLMWPEFSEDMKREVMEAGRTLLPSGYGRPYPITRALIEDGRRNLLLDDATIRPGCPVRILQGQQDPDVPWTHAMDLVSALDGEDVVITLVKDGDHRLSRPQDIARLRATLDGLLEEIATG